MSGWFESRSGTKTFKEVKEELNGATRGLDIYYWGVVEIGNIGKAGAKGEILFSTFEFSRLCLPSKAISEGHITSILILKLSEIRLY